MKKLRSFLVTSICMVAVLFYAMTLKAEAGNVRTGTLGENNGITWTYDEDTKTLTITGEDSGVEGTYDSATWSYKSPFAAICEDVEIIKLQNCTIKGSAEYMFARLKSLKSIEFNNVDTSSATDMTSMFYGCSSLTNLDLSEFNTSKVRHMISMFYGCSSLKSVDVSNFDTSKVTTMSSMFQNCSNLTGVDVSDFDTSNVTTMSCMFYGCSSLKSVDVSNFSTSKVTNMYYMFRGCSSLTGVNVSNFDTSQVTDMKYMFYDCSSLNSLDISGFDLTRVTDVNRMLYGCANLARIETPKTMPETLSIDLPNTYVNPRSERTTKITKALGNTTLINVDFLVSEIKLNASSLTVHMGKGGQLTATIFPEKALNKTLIWKSSDTSVAVTDANGKIIPIAPGTTTITVTATDPGWVSASCSVTVIYPVTSVVLDKTSMSLQTGDTEKLTAIVRPGNATNKTVTWKSSNTAVATVDANGKVTAVGGGTATITATAADGSGKSASCSVTVTQPVTAVALNKTATTIHLGKSATLTVTVSPSNATNKAVTWKSSNTAVATVDSNGKVTAVAVGTATITATAKDGSGKSASCNVAVIRPVTGITLNKTSLNLNVGDTETLTATVSPNNATNRDVTWKSSNTAVATVDASGKVTAVGYGKATITVTAKDGSGTNASCTIMILTEQENKVRAFVERMYTIVLNRPAEEQGLNDWSARLMAKEIDGATLVDMFVNSDEFINRNTSDEEYIKILYRAVLGREADADGLKMWKTMLADDWTRDYIMEGLVLSTEFKSICDSYGIIAAFEPTAESQVRSFVKRMYTVVLGRRADAVGLEEWTQRLLNGTANGAQLADGFISSDEFVNRNLSNEKYVKVLYRAFFNREPDEGGFNVWMNELAKGTSRRDVMKGFVHSVEFSDLCAAYGIIRGEIQ